MITKEEVASYIQSIPAAPAVVREALTHARAGDLTKAAKCAEEDNALKQYLQALVNRPIYSFRNEITGVAQIFGILGVSASQQTLYSYLTSLLAPKKWTLFNLTNHQFFDLQASFSRHWEKILEHLKVDDKEIQSAITLIPASIIVCEALFSSRKNDVDQLRAVKALDYNTILQRLSGYNLFDLSAQIAHKWEMPEQSIKLIRAASGLEKASDPQTAELARWMHLLLFYELSQGPYVSAGLNEFVDFQIDFVQSIYTDFTKVLEYA